MDFKAHCYSKTTDKIIVCKERKRKIVFYNNNEREVEKIKVDGCQITEGERCDYLVHFHLYQNFIELKGEDIPRAIEQLKASMQQLKQRGRRIKCYIISSRSPLSSAAIQKIQLQFYKRYQAELKIKNQIIKVEID